VLPPMSPISGDARPPVSVPHMASRGVPLPHPKPAAAGKQPEVAPQKSASIEVKPEAPAPKPTAPSTVQAAGPVTPAQAATVLAPESRPAPTIAQTQPMPKVQGLE